MAKACRCAKQVEAGFETLTKALAHVTTTGERAFEAKLYRLRDDLLLAWSAAEHRGQKAAFSRQALAIAGRQQAMALELRAAVSLGRQWHWPALPQGTIMIQ